MFRRCFLQVGALVFVVAALALSAQAENFSEASLKGSYSFMINKWTADVGRNQYAMVGVMKFDGAGNVTGSGTQVGGGVSESGALSGTYTVNSDGTGVMELTNALWKPPTNQFTFVLNSATTVAHGFQFVQTDNGNNVVISGSALLLSANPETYSVASVNGTFAFQSNKWTADVNTDEQGGIGVLTFDGKGNLTGSLTNVDQGVVYNLALSGTYTVNADGTCSASLVVSNLGGTPTFACALNSWTLLGGAKGIQLVVTNPGASGTDNSTNYVITVNAVKQNGQ